MPVVRQLPHVEKQVFPHRHQLRNITVEGVEYRKQVGRRITRMLRLD